MKALAVEEPYMNELKGVQVAVGKAFTVSDEKFNNTASWDLIQQNIAVNNIVSFEINFDTSIYFYNQPFESTINFKIYIYGNQSDTSLITDSVTHSNISLQVRYDTTTGKPYKGIALYKFTGAHKFRIRILNLTSPQLSPIPAIFRLKAQIIVDRQYTFNDNSTDVTRYAVLNGNQLQLQWTPSSYPGAEQFDVEYTHIDGMSQVAASIRTYVISGGYSVPADSLNKWFKNNNTRVTTAAAGYLFNIPYDSGFVIFRIRGVQLHYPDGVRWEGNWNYLARESAASCTAPACPSGVVFFNPHESNLNWQYTVSFAEEGKKKEVISYFDASLRNRQTVTINNWDNKNIVQETIYDALGRPAVSIMPAPADDSTIHYFRGFNKNSSGDPYSFTDLLYGSNCLTSVDSVTNVSGAGRYYSANNQFLNRYYYAKYIPAADGYPLAATEYMADNTGRIRSQGGVGPTFQLNAGHATKYFYGKPSQTELDRLFGTEVGNASHYLKNMVVDPNCQISVSYVNASGKTIATALAGGASPNLHALPSTAGASIQMSNDMMQPEDFERNGAGHSVQTTSTFLAPVTGTYVFNYRIDPLRMEKLYGPNKDSVICNNCYYDLVITIKDNCNNIVDSIMRGAGFVFDTSCTNQPGAIVGTFNTDITAIGEYYVNYKLVVSRDALDYYDSVHLVKNSELKRLNYFLLEELKNTDFYGCYSQCETCLDALGTKEEFTQRFKVFYTTDSLAFTHNDSLFVLSLYDSLYAHCVSIQGECATGICDEKLELLKMDVSPGGQYALYHSSNNSLSEPTINVLAKRNQIAFFTDPFGSRDSVQLHNINGEDSVKLDVKDLSDSLFIAYWKDNWADSLVRLHPEYCRYLWCIANSESYEFDSKIEDWQDADTAMAFGWFNPNKYDSILEHDPFFLSGGNGYSLRNKMRDDLLKFSRTYAGTSKPDRNILQFIDIVLYCNNQYNGWEACQPDSACRSRNREWFLYQQLYLNLKQKYYEEARRTSSDTIFSNCVNCYIGKDAVEFLGIVPDTGAYVPFSSSNSCNYNCAGGIYDPYDKSNISLYIEYGSPDSEPTGTPAGYGNCRFYSNYLLQKTVNSSCQYFNVWVCTYDSTCSGVCPPVTSYPSYCPDNPNASLYQNKDRRYPEYVNSESFINDVLSSNPQQKSTEYGEQVIVECQSTCEAQADIWIKQLARCTTDTSKLAQLKQALIDICAAGCSAERPFGSSTIPDTTTATYHSFEEAMLGILGTGSVNDSCTAELLSNPYPYDKQPVYGQRVIVQSNYEICQKVTLQKKAWQTSGFNGSFHAYLQKQFGTGYHLDSTELDGLLNSCSNCSGILKNDLVLPLAFEPDASPCALCDSATAALTAFNTKFPSIDSTRNDYEQIFANFFNHRFGYSLTFNEYRSFLDSCTANPLYSVSLCNKPATEEATIENNNDGCMADLFATALTNANNTYVVYIDSVRQDFQEAYLTRCLNVQPALKMTAELFEYHYTLYYYDQAGNLVKTIPPEGVALLDSSGLDLVKQWRRLQSEGCYQYSDSIHLDNNAQITWAVTDSFEARSYTGEMMLNLDAHANQVLISKLSEYTYDTTGGVNFFYRHAGFVAKIESNKLVVNVFGIGADTIQRKATAVSVLNAPSIIPLHQWTHVVVQRTGYPDIPVQVWVNGNPVALQFTVNDLDSASRFGGTASLVAGSHNAPHLTVPGKLQGTIKNLRIYNRVLLASEIRQNTYNYCQTPANNNGLLFWSAMNNAKGNLVRDLVTQQDGTLAGFTWLPFEGVFPEHRLPTVYTYNSLGQVLQQFSPDGDTSQFFYDRLGRLIVSQNKEQKDSASYSGAANRFSYTSYDVLGRIVEVGEKSSPTSNIRTINLLDTTAVKNWQASGTNRQVTKTLYDDPVNLDLQSSSTSRKRVVASVYLENASDTEGDSTIYSYDIVGNAKTLVQHVKALVAVDATNGKKKIDYDYDLVSGKVNVVSYQQGKGDQFFYKYQYDAENRLVRALTSRDRLIWNEDGSYVYYLHGPLARSELGHLKVQGTDYAYTLQGWIKGINGDEINAATELGGDGKTGSIFSRVSRDVYGLQLGYYNNDYKPIGGSSSRAFGQHGYTAPSSLAATGNQLFNGNISFTTLALSKINSGATTGYSYGYDQLNRLAEMRQHSTSGSWSNSNIISAYSESISYDANGNILKYLRKGANVTGLPLDMDSLTYNYNRGINGKIVNNKLNYISDQISAGNYTVDIDNQASNNYQYDKIGNLIKDVAEGLDTVRWTVYGKINRIAKSASNKVINFGYDAGGNRTLKQVNNHDTVSNTFYVRDGQGNMLAVYENSSVSSGVKWVEQHLYGSSRIGMWQWDTVVPALPPVAQNTSPLYDSLLVGSRSYELGNHLGNILATVSDKKIGNDSSGIINYYIAEVLSQNDYYPFGMLMPGRRYNVSSYRFGFNGKENDNDVKGEGNQQDYGMRIYDPRVGRFLSIDPLTTGYPWYTPYSFAGNKPVWKIDIDGLEEVTDANEQYWGTQPKIDMTNAPGTSTNAAGHVRNGLWHAKQAYALKPEMFSEAAKNAIFVQKVMPIVDEQWVKYNPAAADYIGQSLNSHHIDGEKMAVLIPRRMHYDKFSELHAYLKNKGDVTKGGKVGGMLGGALNVIGTVSMFNLTNPDSWINAFGAGEQPESYIGKVKKDFENNVYLEVNSVKFEFSPILDNNGNPVVKDGQVQKYLSKRIVTATWYSGYIWDEDSKSYKGVDKIKTTSEVWNYDSNGKRKVEKLELN
ncbi:RHS repeat-associated core domain-containing protein [Longitalea luteola]|uniref:RHS repeat-associated core domain-containing protein n=1 Tax=Longitalea luteola TaxID=2812563 RepID=UPI001A97C887